MSTVLLIYKCPDLFPDGSCRCYCQVILCYTLFSECDCQYIWCAILKKVYLYTLNCHFILYRYNKRSEHTSTFFILENKRRLIQFIVGISNSDFFLTGKVRSLFLNLEPFSKLAFTMNATSNATVVRCSVNVSELLFKNCIARMLHGFAIEELTEWYK